MPTNNSLLQKNPVTEPGIEPRILKSVDNDVTPNSYGDSSKRLRPEIWTNFIRCR